MSNALPINETDIAGLTCDSRRVAPGFLFAALPGSKVDGRAYIAEALARGAVAVLAPPGTRIDAPGPTVPVIVDDNPRRRFSLLAARFFSGQPATVAAVTGTNGKTSVAAFLRQIWTRLGRKAASMGTLGVTAPGLEIAGSLTTPDPVMLHETLRTLAGRGVGYLAMEASSHGLDQCRLDGVAVTAGGFTNLSRDHLDYHGTMEAYLAAKMRLFAEVMTPGGTVVVNVDDPAGEAVSAAATANGHRLLSYGAGAADIELRNAEPLPSGQRLDLHVAGADHTVDLPLVGDFQAGNALCALGLAMATGEDARTAVAALEFLEGAPGRVERVGAPSSGASVFVDYAHTPDALAKVLRALRPHARGRLVVVFGCGGERDPGKRPEMGRIVEDLADAAIITDDNPRGEDAATIRRQISVACPSARDIGDRRAAIRTAVAGLRAGDVLVVAGKGHEQGQIVGGEVRPFDDADEVRSAITEAGP